MKDIYNDYSLFYQPIESKLYSIFVISYFILEKNEEGVMIAKEIVRLHLKLRKAEYIADLDLLVNDAEVYCSFINEIKIHSNFTLLVQGPKKVSFLIDNAEKTQVDITLNEDPKLIGYATLHFTGSKEFNIRCRNAAIKKGYRLSQNGLKPIDSNTPEAPELLTEKEILSFIGIGYVKPENR